MALSIKSVIEGTTIFFFFFLMLIFATFCRNVEIFNGTSAELLPLGFIWYVRGNLCFMTCNTSKQLYSNNSYQLGNSQLVKLSLADLGFTLKKKNLERDGRCYSKLELNRQYPNTISLHRSLHKKMSTARVTIGGQCVLLPN